MKLGDLLRGASTRPPFPRRRRRKARAGLPLTIIPVADGDAAPPALLERLDSARERLRREIPPVGDDE